MTACRTLFLFAACAAFAMADRITLVDGREYDGIILREDDEEVCLRLARGTVTFPRDQVKEIVREKGALAQRDERLEGLTPDRPADYLALAEWLNGDGRAARDPRLSERLCAIAAALDPALACRANMLLGRGFEAAGDTAGAALAYGRARNAAPGDAEARAAADRATKLVEDGARRATEDLRRGLELLGQDLLSEAAPLLLRGRASPAAALVRKRLGMPVDDVVKAIRRRVPCGSCDGQGTIACTRCAGTGVIRCSVCNGKGRLSQFNVGDTDEAWVRIVCRSCLMLGDALCDNCHAERNVWLYLGAQAKSRDAGLASRGLAREYGRQVFCKAGEERAAFKAVMDIPTWRMNDQIVRYVEKDPISAGGTRTCPTCEGVRPDPGAVLPVAPASAATCAWLADILSDREAFEFVPAVKDTFDPAIAADREYYWREGKWCTMK